MLSSAAANPQNRPTTRVSHELASVQVKGAVRLTEQQIVQASGLQLGRDMADAEFKLAAQKLADTGLFEEVTYSYRYSPEGCNLVLQVTENNNLVPVLFDNFVWFRDDELLGLLRSQIPLFDGRLPLGGSLPDRVASALNTILAQRKITGEAAYDRASDDNGRVNSYVYKLNFHPVEIRSVIFPGASAPELAALEEASKPLLGGEYSRLKMDLQEQSIFLPVYLARGYVKAHFDRAQARVAGEGSQTLVDVSLPVTPGVPYKLTKISWSGNLAVPTGQLAALLRVKVGEPVNAVRLRQDLHSVQRLYGTKGYLNAQITPVEQVEQSTSTIAYQLTVAEGDLYRMGDLSIDGIDSATIARILDQWQMKKGQPYDNTYMHRFFDVMYRDTGLHRSYSIIPKQQPNPQDKTVSVALHFVPK